MSVLARIWKSSINRNIMECKDGYATFGDPVEFVLIETLWNVKIANAPPISTPICINRNIMECKEQTEAPLNGLGTVLIETLWNVKKRGHLIFLAILCINRNIMECKA